MLWKKYAQTSVKLAWVKPWTVIYDLRFALCLVGPCGQRDRDIQRQIWKCRLKAGHKLSWSHDRELGLHGISDVELTNVFQKQKSKWNWIRRLFSNFLLDSAFVSHKYLKSSSWSKPSSFSSLPLYSSSGAPHLIYGHHHLQEPTKPDIMGHLYFLFIPTPWSTRQHMPSTLIHLLSTFSPNLLSGLSPWTYTNYS